jgi:hypothetical protein
VIHRVTTAEVRLKQSVRACAQAVHAASFVPLGLAVKLYGGTDKLLHAYTAPYSRHFRRVRYRRNRVLEIGVGGYESRDIGGSLRIWRDYFPRSQIFGLDIHDKDVRLGPRVRFVRGDQSSNEDLGRLLAEMDGPPDIVIDDGSHFVGHALASLATLFPRMPRGGIYAIEDLSTSYWTDWGGAIPAPESSAVGLVKGLVDAVQDNDPTFSWSWAWVGPAPQPHWLADVDALHVYPGLAVLEKA